MPHLQYCDEHVHLTATVASGKVAEFGIKMFYF